RLGRGLRGLRPLLLRVLAVAVREVVLHHDRSAGRDDRTGPDAPAPVHPETDAHDHGASDPPVVLDELDVLHAVGGGDHVDRSASEGGLQRRLVGLPEQPEGLALLSALPGVDARALALLDLLVLRRLALERIEVGGVDYGFTGHRW